MVGEPVGVEGAKVGALCGRSVTGDDEGLADGFSVDGDQVKPETVGAMLGLPVIGLSVEGDAVGERVATHALADVDALGEYVPSLINVFLKENHSKAQ